MPARIVPAKKIIGSRNVMAAGPRRSFVSFLQRQYIHRRQQQAFEKNTGGCANIFSDYFGSVGREIESSLSQ